RNADGFVAWFDRFAPGKLVNYLELYTEWVGQLGTTRRTSLASTLARRWALQMMLNAALVATIFAGAAWELKHLPPWLTQMPLGPEVTKAALWLSAAILSLPLFIAIFRKLQALGMLVAETRVSRETAGERATAIRALVAQAVVIAGVIILALYVLA